MRKSRPASKQETIALSETLKGLRTQHIAKILDVTPATLYNWLDPTNNATPGRGKLEKLRRMLGVIQTEAEMKRNLARDILEREFPLGAMGGPGQGDYENRPPLQEVPWEG